MPPFFAPVKTCVGGVQSTATVLLASAVFPAESVQLAVTLMAAPWPAAGCWRGSCR